MRARTRSTDTLAVIATSQLASGPPEGSNVEQLRHARVKASWTASSARCGSSTMRRARARARAPCAAYAAARPSSVHSCAQPSGRQKRCSDVVDGKLIAPESSEPMTAGIGSGCPSEASALPNRSPLWRIATRVRRSHGGARPAGTAEGTAHAHFPRRASRVWAAVRPPWCWATRGSARPAWSGNFSPRSLAMCGCSPRPARTC